MTTKALKQVALEKLRRDGGTQMRQHIDDGTVQDYAESYRNGAVMPPVVAFFDGKVYWLADGHHRVRSAGEAGLTALECEVHKGTRRDAVLFAVGCNTTNGLRRSQADKRTAVSTLLNDPEWRECSNRWIAEKARVSDMMVADIRKQVCIAKTSGARNCTSDDDGAAEKRRGRDGKAYTTSRRRRSRSSPAHVPPIDADKREEIGAALLRAEARQVKSALICVACGIAVMPKGQCNCDTLETVAVEPILLADAIREINCAVRKTLQRVRKEDRESIVYQLRGLADEILANGGLAL